tara:strand:- start:847 stop:1155 length:309 start_codon:yes stop_codon:yes gene_type:complete
MIKHIQKSTKKKGFWQPEFVDEVLQEIIYYWRDLEIIIPETDLSIMEDGDRIYVEENIDPLSSIKGGSSALYIPLSGEIASSPGAVIWKEGGEIHYLYHEEE